MEAGLGLGGEGVGIRPDLPAQSFQSAERFAVGDMGRTAESHMFQEMSKAALVGLLMDRADIEAEAESDLILGRVVTADGIAHAIGQTAIQHLGIGRNVADILRPDRCGDGGARGEPGQPEELVGSPIALPALAVGADAHAPAGWGAAQHLALIAAAIGANQRSLAVLAIELPLALIALALGLDEQAMARALAGLPLAVIAVAILPSLHPFAFGAETQTAALIAAAIGGLDQTGAVELIVLPLAFDDGAVGKAVQSVAGARRLHPISAIEAAIGPGLGAETVDDVVGPIPFIAAAIGPGQDAIAMPLAIAPLPDRAVAALHHQGAEAVPSSLAPRPDIAVAIAHAHAIAVQTAVDPVADRFIAVGKILAAMAIEAALAETPAFALGLLAVLIVPLQVPFAVGEPIAAAAAPADGFAGLGIGIPDFAAIGGIGDPSRFGGERGADQEKSGGESCPEEPQAAARLRILRQAHLETWPASQPRGFRPPARNAILTTCSA